MKRSILLLTLLFTVINSEAQRQPGSNFFEFMYNYYQEHPYFTPDSLHPRSGALKYYDREYEIWGPRLYPNGNCNEAARKIFQYTEEFTNQVNPAFVGNPLISWNCLGPTGLPAGVPLGAGNGQIHRLTFDPQYNGVTNKTIYAASMFGGLWRSENDGDYWSLVNTDTQLPSSSVSDIAVDFNNSNTLFISTGNGDDGLSFSLGPNWGNVNPLYTYGIYRSTNYGTTWTAINEGFMSFFQTESGTTRRLKIDPSNSNRLFIATSKGIFRTENALATTPQWTLLSNGLNPEDNQYRGIEFKPYHSSTVYASGRDIYKSTDHGNSWSSLTGPTTGLDFEEMLITEHFAVSRINITVTPADSSRLYAFIVGNSTDPSGEHMAYVYLYNEENSPTWRNVCSNINNDNNFPPNWMGFAASPLNAGEISFGGMNIHTLENVDQNTFCHLSPGGHADIHALAYQPVLPPVNPSLFAGTHGGVERGTQRATPFFNYAMGEKYEGLQLGLIWSFGNSRIDKKTYMTGQQDCGIIVPQQTGNSWIHIHGGDGYGTQILDEKKRIFNFIGNSNLALYSYSQLQGTGGWDDLPIDPVYQSSVLVPKTFKILHGNFLNPVCGFTNLYERKYFRPNEPEMWELESDIHNIEQIQHKRQITEAAIALSDTNFIYIVTAGQIDSIFNDIEPRMYRSTSGGNNGNSSVIKFEEISDFLPVLSDPHISHPIITGIAVHPDTATTLWITCTGFDSISKVWVSHTGGVGVNNWTPCGPTGIIGQMPVNGIVYQPGSNDRLFIATDFGVYYKDNTMNEWQKYGNIPNVRVVELTINPCNNKLLAATFGRGLWEVDLPPSDGHLAKIENSQEWDYDRILENGFVVKSPYTLTIRDTVYMPKDSKIVVEAGAHLILDGGTLLQNCGYLWKGIEVWGNANLSQNIPGSQGKISILRESRIENAEIAILMGKRLDENGTFDPGSSGGLLWCTDGKFLNNKTAIHFTPYPNYNNSYIRRSEFITDKELAGAALPDCFVKIYGNSDIRIQGCMFKNNREWACGDIEMRGTGVWLDNSRVYITEYCDAPIFPCTPITAGSFEKLSRGVYAMNHGNIANIDVRNIHFSNTIKGLYLSGYSGVSNPSVTLCSFNVYRPGESYIESYGMYLNECSGYQIEENSFYAEGADCDGIGLVINNSICDNPSEINQVYKNTFTNLLYATIAQNRNRNFQTGEGLCYRCNKFFDNFSDISVTKLNSNPSTKGMGIGVNQGAEVETPQGPAGNMFDFSPLPSHWDLNNQCPSFNYFYHDGSIPSGMRVRPFTVFCSGQITLRPVDIEFDEEEACPSHLNPGGMIEELEEYSDSKVLADSLIEVHETTVDAGSTAEMSEEVADCTPADAPMIYNELITISPYVSDSVVQNAIQNEESLSNVMIRDVMISNPHASKSDETIDMIAGRSNPMPDYMMEQILQGEDSISAKELLEAERNYWSSQKSQHQLNLIRYYRSDTTCNFFKDSLAVVLQLENTLSSFYERVMMDYTRRSYSTGDSILNMIPDLFVLTEEQANLHDQYIAFFSILKKLAQDSTAIFAFSVADQNSLLTITGNGEDRVHAMARNLLLAAGLIEYVEPLVLPESGLKNSKRERYKGAKTVTEGNLLKVYPNPAIRQFTVEYHLTSLGSQTTLTFSDLLGKPLSSILLNRKDDQLLLKTGTLPPGTYVISINNNQEKFIQTSVSIIH